MTGADKRINFFGDSEWKDLLTGFKLTAESSSDNIDTQITYDANGNVTAFDGSTYTWTAGRQLESSSGDDNTVRYFYNENGYLTRVDFYDEDTDSYPGGYVFIWDGDRLVSRSMVLYESNLEFMTSRIIYDSDGEAQGFSFVYNDDSGESSMENTVFLYRKNLQGDITGIILPDGSLAAEFTYDAYGNVELHPAENTLGGALLAIFMLAVTPQLYRGYIYVPVGGSLCYYLGSRFYSPKLGRFLNADIHTDTGTGVVGTNMFAYCNNNPVVCIDPNGTVTKYNSIIGYNQLMKMIKWITDCFIGLKSFVTTAQVLLLYNQYVSIAKSLAKTYTSITGLKVKEVQVDTTAQKLAIVYTPTQWLARNNSIVMMFYYGTLKYWQHYIAGTLERELGVLGKFVTYCNNNPAFGLALSDAAKEINPYLGLAWDAINLACSYIEYSNDINRCIIDREKSQRENGRVFTGNEKVVVFSQICYLSLEIGTNAYHKKYQDIYECNDF